VFGAFFWQYQYVALAQEFVDRIFDEDTYVFINGMSMWMYLSHYIWIVLICHFIVRPHKLGLMNAILVNLFGSLFLIVASYWVLIKVKEGFTNKSKEGKQKKKVTK
jgi:hypothetical protein